MFQSLTWVERLSDRGAFDSANLYARVFQSLTWVERLSDLLRERRAGDKRNVSIPHLG